MFFVLVILRPKLRMWSNSRQFWHAACKFSIVNEVCIIGGTGVFFCFMKKIMKIFHFLNFCNYSAIECNTWDVEPLNQAFCPQPEIILGDHRWIAINCQPEIVSLNHGLF